jgi:hypothetical protein
VETPERVQAIHALQCPQIFMLSISHPERLHVRDLLFAAQQKTDPSPDKAGFGMTNLKVGKKQEARCMYSAVFEA